MGTPLIHGFSVQRYVRDRVVLEDRGHTSPCWVWQLSLKRDGYAFGKPPGYRTMVRIARAAYEAFVGPIPEGMEIDHLCRQPSCCNPDHLESVTRAENMARRVASKTTCRRGHPFEGDNLYVTPVGVRTCRTCKIERERARPPRRAAA
jgi:hypothetical protein